MFNKKAPRFGELLIKAKLITEEQLEEALVKQRSTGQKLGKALIETGAISERQLCETLGYQLGVPFVDLEALSLDPAVVNLIPQDTASRYSLIAFERSDATISVAVVNPLDVIAIDNVAAMTGKRTKVFVAIQSVVEDAIQKYYRLDELIFDTLKEVSSGDSIELLQEKSDSEDAEEMIRKSSQAPIVRLVDFILSDAIKNGASDIHIEPQYKNVQVRFRIDGILHDRLDAPKYVQESLVSRIKIISRLDISEKRKPQDGRAHIKVNDRGVDLRISTLPTIYGEKIVIRILDKSKMPLNLAALGLDKEIGETLESFLHSTKGIILVTGPTGSGKTTTLYASLNQIKSRAKNVVTVEDPVEYAVDGINQVQVNEKAGVTFATGMRSILRQDPDVILVGEIRDSVTAEIAFESALTGHLVLSTLHTNSAPGAIIRLLELGVEHYLISEAIVGVIAQRLLRKLCEQCKKEYIPDAELLHLVGLSKKDIENKKIYKAVGCEECGNLGYKGRIAIFEIFKAEQAVMSQLTGRIAESTLTNIARMSGMKSLKEDGVEKVFRGVTAFEEVLRVTYEQEEQVTNCPQCGKLIDSRFSVCPFCEQSLGARECAQCGEKLDPMWIICPYCKTRGGGTAKELSKASIKTTKTEVTKKKK
ncbi:MAG: ATPase, T2SS/T4P/T4SS family [Candidatus Omnitrophota bacterium]